MQEVTNRWCRGEMSNFDYLLFLNFLSGRTFHDLAQYPVFPWVIADLSSAQLDVNRKGTLRDLTRPIGALNPARLQALLERYKVMESAGERPFLYGTHYSCPAYVMFYSVRAAPSVVLKLQSGRFDAPDRSFHSVSDTWDSVYNNPADVKELIPEFYIPAVADVFLTNHQSLSLGVRQNGTVVGNVVLPPWCKGSAGVFVQTLRDVLESEQVSLQLHQWVDLIFGYKQRGKLAKDAYNEFHPMTYEQNLPDLEKMTNLTERSAMEVQIREFGQTPQQLFFHAHPPRRNLQPVSSLSADPLHILAVIEAVAAGTGGGSLPGGSNQAQQQQQQRYGDTENEADADSSVATSLAQLARRNQVFAKHGVGSSSSSASSSGASSSGLGPSGRGLVAWKMQADKVPQRLHRDAITDVQLSADGTLVYTTSKDSSLRIYDMKAERQVRAVTNLSSNQLALSCCRVMRSKGGSPSQQQQHVYVGSWDSNVYAYAPQYGRVSHTFAGHDDAIAGICLWENMGRMASASWDSTAKLWDMTKPQHWLMDFTDHDSAVKAIANDQLEETPALFVTGTADGVLHVWDVRQSSGSSSSSPSSAAVTMHLSEGSAVRSMDMSLVAGMILASCADDPWVRVFDLRTGGRLVTEFIPSTSFQHVPTCIRTDGVGVWTGYSDGSLICWDLKTAAMVSSTSVSPGAEVTCFDFRLGDGGLRVAVSGSADASVRLWS